MVVKVFYVKDYKILYNNEKLKMHSFEYEKASNLGIEKDGYYFVIDAPEEFFEELNKEEIEEITGEEKEEILKKFEEREKKMQEAVSFFD